jgi:hypothetical protein
MIRGYADRTKTKNLQAIINENILSPLFEHAARKPGIEGIVMLGGGARRSTVHPDGFGDRYCDVDLALFVNAVQEWLPLFEFYVPDTLGADMEQGWFEINCHQMLIPLERQERRWSDAQKKQAYEEGIIIYDPRGSVRRLLSERCVHDDILEGERAAQLQQAYLSYRSSGDPVSDHLGLNKMLNQAVELSFLANHEYRTHKKWRFEATLRLPDLPSGAEELFTESLLVRSATQEDVVRRKRCLDEIFSYYAGSIPHLRGHTQPACDDHRWSVEDMLCLIVGQFYWLVERNPLRQMQRGFPLNAHDLLNEGLGMSLEAVRLMYGLPLLQEVQALGVMNPHPYYPEEDYDLFVEPSLTGQECLQTFRELVMDSLRVPDLTDATIVRRRQALEELTRSVKRTLELRSLCPSDPYHHAVRSGLYSDRQLLERTYGECVCPHTLGADEQRLFTGFTSYNLVGDNRDLAEALRNPVGGIYTREQRDQIRKIAGDNHG